MRQSELPRAPACPATPRDPTRPSASRVFRADPDAPEAPPGPRLELHPAEEPELVEVRCLLAALRPDRDGPLGWPPDGHPPAHQGALPPVVVQTGTGGGDTPRGAFQGTPARTDGTLARERIERLVRDHPTEALTLSWLQSSGSLAAGLGALYDAAGQALATREERERWTRPELRRLGARGVGRARVTAARKVWWGEQEVHSA